MRGSFFADYVRTLRRNRDANWKRFLKPDDAELVAGQIAPGGWYPMDVFERLGTAILYSVADFSFTVPYAWGRVSAGQITSIHEGLIEPGDPGGAFLRLHGLRGVFFNFDPVIVTSCTDDEARIEIDYQMRDIPEAAACYQAQGFYEGIVGLCGCRVTASKIIKRRWEGHDNTVITISWGPLHQTTSP